MFRKVALALLLLTGLALLGGCSGQSEEPRMTPAAANEGLSTFTPVAATAKTPVPPTAANESLSASTPVAATAKSPAPPTATNEGLSASTPVAATAKPPAPRAGHPAPDFTLTDLTGNELSLRDFEGQVVLVNFWATW